MTGVEVVTALVVMVKVPLLVPAGTVTLGGTVAAALLLARETATPPVGAGAFRVTVPVDGVPPTTVGGLSARLLTWRGGVTVRVAVTDPL